MKSQERPAGSEFDAGEDYRPTDAELGVGEDDAAHAAASPDIAELLNRPEVKAAIDGLVAQRVKELAQPAGEAAAPAAAPDPATVALLSTFAQVIAAKFGEVSLATASQQPGYVKLVPLEEIEARAAAYIDMLALIEDAKRTGNEPVYLLTEDFHALDFLWAKGDTMFWWGPPNIEMVPQNPVASAIFAKMLRWIGGGTAHIADQVAEAYQEARGKKLPDPGVYARSETPSLGEVYRDGIRQQKLAGRVEGPRRDVGPRRVVGTVTPEGPAGAHGGPVRQPAAGAMPQVGTVMPVESPSAAQHF